MFVAYTILLVLVMAGLYTERGCITVPVLADAQANQVPVFVADILATPVKLYGKLDDAIKQAL